MAWVERNDITLPPPKKKNHTVQEILKHLDSLDLPVVVATYTIADKYGHTIIETPPYHCEVQPIERVWALVKNPIALNPIIKETAVQLRDRLLIHFSKITKRQLISIWRKALKACQGHLILATEQQQHEAVLDIGEQEIEELEIEE